MKLDQIATKAAEECKELNADGTEKSVAQMASVIMDAILEALGLDDPPLRVES